ncbi:Hypothetical predicted protein [Mytilus galloprovincialis]|uniref:Uncharacterized protein n=2 Tax=Mytilus galloprovincialis TaxID=29158 RepID=A0A8B6H1A5_MYTGA|nr:Hypothetical predicted protein [Mytilus galloprovincialis]
MKMKTVHIALLICLIVGIFDFHSVSADDDDDDETDTCLSCKQSCDCDCIYAHCEDKSCCGLKRDLIRNP